MPTYRERYDRNAQPISAGHPDLGDPSKFGGAPLLDGGYKWGTFNDTRQRAFAIMLLNPKGEPAYVWPEIPKRNIGGFSAASEAFKAIEQANARQLGIDCDPELWVEPIYKQVRERDQLSVLTGGAYNLNGDKMIWVPSGGDAIYRDPMTFGRGSSGLSYWSQGKPTIKVGETSNKLLLSSVCREHVILPYKGIKFIANVNTWLRIGFIMGTLGEVSGGDPVFQIFKTVWDLAQIILGYFTGNVCMIMAALLDIVMTWYSFAMADAEAAELAWAVGKKLGAYAQGFGGDQPSLNNLKKAGAIPRHASTDRDREIAFRAASLPLLLALGAALL